MLGFDLTSTAVLFNQTLELTIVKLQWHVGKVQVRHEVTNAFQNQHSAVVEILLLRIKKGRGGQFFYPTHSL